MKYTVTVKKSYVQEMDVIACDVDEARKLAIDLFDPKDAEVFSVDVFGLDPWTLGEEGDPNAHDKYRQAELDDRV